MSKVWWFLAALFIVSHGYAVDDYFPSSATDSFGCRFATPEVGSEVIRYHWEGDCSGGFANGSGQVRYFKGTPQGGRELVYIIKGVMKKGRFTGKKFGSK
ncbi:hypothetical protein [Bdellovibrio sp. GT3]|uniref:hypothetical protein n=1 Tax=Bdellovibrio sp. GT3 TaxID=3136282 RepID=UPI0030F062F6